MTSSAPLLRLLDALGVGQRDLAPYDGPNRLVFSFDVPGSVVATLQPAVLDDLVADYGSALEVQISIGDLAKLTCAGGYSGSDLAALVAAAPGIPSYTLSVDCQKAALVTHLLGGRAGAADVRCYFTTKGFAGALRQAVRTSVQDLWVDGDRRLVVAVFDAEVAVRAEMLSVLGGSHLTDLRAEVDRPAGPRAELAEVRERREARCSWDGRLTTALTPRHLTPVTAVGDVVVREAVDDAATLLTLLHLCDRTRSIGVADGPRLDVELRGPRSSVVVPVAWDASTGPVSDEERSALRAILDWCYQHDDGHGTEVDWLGDRLPFVQERLASVLEPVEPSLRLSKAVELAPDVLGRVRYDWQVFVEERIAAYFEGVERVETAVTTALDGYTARIAALVKGLTDAMLAGVGVVVGSFIGAALADPFEDTLFAVSMLVYAAYVLLFLLAVGLFSARGDAAQADATFARQRSQLERSVGALTVEEIVDDRVQVARTRFDRWWAVCLAGYALVGGAAVFAAGVVPQHV